MVLTAKQPSRRLEWDPRGESAVLEKQVDERGAGRRTWTIERWEAQREPRRHSLTKSTFATSLTWNDRKAIDEI